MSFEAWHEWSASVVLKVQQTKKKEVKIDCDQIKYHFILIVIKLNIILYWLLLHKISTVCRKNELFMFEKRQSIKKSHQKRKISKVHSKHRQHV